MSRKQARPAKLRGVVRDRARRAMLEAMAQMAGELDGPGLGNPEAERDVPLLEEHALPAVWEQLAALAAAERRFVPRIHVLGTAAAGGPDGAPAVRVEPGDPEFLSGGWRGLRARMDAALAGAAPHGVAAMWTCPFHGQELDGLLAVGLLRHTSGVELLYLASSTRGMTRVPSDEQLRDVALQAMTLGQPALEEQLLELPAAEQTAPPGVPDVQLLPQARAALEHPEVQRFIEGLCRRAAARSVAECAKLAAHASTMVVRLHEARQALASKATEEADLSRDRQFRRLSGELEVARTLAAGAARRADRADEECRRLRQGLAQAPQRPAPQDAGDDGLAVALAGLFGVAPERARRPAEEAPAGASS